MRDLIGLFEKLKEIYPDFGKPFLRFGEAYQLMVAVILSAQCTDKLVNRVSPGVFRRFPTIEDLAEAPVEEISEAIRQVNYYRTKAQRISDAARYLISECGGRMPDAMEGLLAIPGIGRKSANVILGEIFHKPAITVDTHVKRLAFRIGFTCQTDPEKVERDLQAVWPREDWFYFSNLLIWHGRTVCKARAPQCGRCVIVDECGRNGVLTGMDSALL